MCVCEKYALDYKILKSQLYFNGDDNIYSMDIDIEDDEEKVLVLQKLAFELWLGAVKSLAFILNK